MRHTHGTLHGWPVAVCLLAVTLAVALGLRFEWKLDDAYIAFSYAQNWVAGHGLVFNVGERVEGYTCFLWVALAALGLWLGADIVWWSTALGLLAAAGAVGATWGLARALAPVRLRRVAVLSTVLVAAYPPFAWWAASGMETALFTCLVTAALWLHVRDGADSMAAPICLALASMTRPEAWLLSLLLCADAARQGSWRRALRYAALFLAIFGPFYAWRCWYYGYPLPNTFYAKVGTTTGQLRRGAAYLLLFLSDAAVWLLLAGTAGALLTRFPRRVAAVYVFCAAYTGYVIVVGGDVFPLHRFFIPLIPTLAALSVAGVLHWAGRPRASPVHRAAVTAGLFTGAFLAACVPLYLRQAHELGVTRRLNELGAVFCTYVTERTGPDDSVAAVGIGRLKYCSRRRVIDIVGLTDLHIAHRAVPTMGEGAAGHEKYDSEYVLTQRPKYIFIGTEASQPIAGIEPIRDMWKQPLLHRDYVPEGSGLLAWYRRRDAPPLLPAPPRPAN